MLLAGALLAAGNAAAQPALICPPAATATGRACETFHYHQQMYRPESRTFVELTGINQFASQAACERAREGQMKRNLAVVDHLKRVKGDEKYDSDRFGPCHCDMTVDKGSSTYLSDLQRTAQRRTAEETRQRVRERLLDGGLTSESELVRSLWASEPIMPLLGRPKIVPPPPASAGASSAVNGAGDLKSTRAVDTSRPVVAALDLPLVDVAVAPPAPEPPQLGGAPPPSAAPASSPDQAPSPVPATSSIDVNAAEGGGAPPSPAEVVVAVEEAPAPPAADAPSEEELASAQEAAESFISYETERIQNVLTASSAITDETVKSKIYEACSQRIQLLSNLRLLIEGSGMRSRLAAAARTAQTEADRLAVVEKLFGSEIRPHWAPKDAADVVLEGTAPSENEAERTLRDSSSKYTEQQKKRALYHLLAQSQPTEEQRLWLTSIIDTFMQ
jgi:hypothetical protein